MLLTVVLLVVSGAEPVKLAAPGLSAVGFDAALAEVYFERCVTVFGADPNLRVTTAKDIQRALGLERQKQLLGCAEDRMSCLAELAGGLGVHAIIAGSIAKTGSTITVTLRGVRASDGAELASDTGRVDSEDALGEWLDDAALRLRVKVLEAFGRQPGLQQPSRWPRLVPGVAGVALVAGGSVALVVASGQASRLRAISSGEPSNRDEVTGIGATGRITEGLGFGLIAAGCVGVAASAAWVLFLGGEVAPAVVPVADGAVVTFGGTW